MNKFILKCTKCDYETKTFQEWFTNGQKCIKCGNIYAETIYNNLNKTMVKKLLDQQCIENLWHYFDLLPLTNRKNITTLKEGIYPIERWEALEKIVLQYFDVKCEIRVLRNDNNPGTGTFKDLAGTVVSSVLKENKIKNYVVASTGNIASAFSRYLSLNDINLYAFLPADSSDMQVAEIQSNGGIAFKVDGDYHTAKHMAKDFATKHNFLLAATGIDPTRIEAKKTMIYEIYRQLQKIPDIYIQALSGGTGPIGIYKGAKELINLGIINNIPRLLLVQSNKCAPMADGYQEAKQNNFPSQWNQKFPIYDNPKTTITTIATGNPSLFPFISQMTKDTNGDIFSVNEDYAKSTSKLIALLEGVKIGPAAAIAIEGLFKSLNNQQINDNDCIVINIGEGIKGTPDYLLQFVENDRTLIKNIDECSIETNKEQIIADLIKNIKCFV